MHLGPDAKITGPHWGSHCFPEWRARHEGGNTFLSAPTVSVGTATRALSSACTAGRAALLPALHVSLLPPPEPPEHRTCISVTASLPSRCLPAAERKGGCAEKLLGKHSHPLRVSTICRSCLLSTHYLVCISQQPHQHSIFFFFLHTKWKYICHFSMFSKQLILFLH